MSASVAPSPPRESAVVRNPRSITTHQQLIAKNSHIKSEKSTESTQSQTSPADEKKQITSNSDNTSNLYRYSPSSMLSIQTPLAGRNDSLGDISPTGGTSHDLVERRLEPLNSPDTTKKRASSIAAATTTADQSDSRVDEDDTSSGSSFSLDEDSLSLQNVAQAMRSAANNNQGKMILQDGMTNKCTSNMKRAPQQLSPALLSNNSFLSDFIKATPSPSRGAGNLYPITQSPASGAFPVVSDEFSGLTPLAISLLEESIQRGSERDTFESEVPAIFGDRALANALRRITEERKDGYVRYGNTVVPAAAIERFERSEAALTLSTQLDELSLRASPSFGRKGYQAAASPNFNPVGSINSPVSLHSTYRQELANVMGSSLRAGSLATPSRRAVSASPARYSILSHDYSDAFGGVLPLSLTQTNFNFNSTVNNFNPLSHNQRGSVSSHGSPLPTQRRNTLQSPAATDVTKAAANPLEPSPAATREEDEAKSHSSPMPTHPTITVTPQTFTTESAVETNTGVTRLTAEPRAIVAPTLTSIEVGPLSEVIDYTRVQSETMKPIHDLKECFPASPIVAPNERKSKVYKAVGSASKAILSRKSSKNSVTSGFSNDVNVGTRTPSPAPAPFSGPLSPKTPDSESPIMRPQLSTAEGRVRDPETTLTIFQGRKMTVAERDRRIQQEAERVEKLRNRAAAYLSYEQKGRKVLEKLECAPKASPEQLLKGPSASSAQLLRGTLSNLKPPSKPSHLSPISHRPRPLSAN